MLVLLEGTQNQTQDLPKQGGLFVSSSDHCCECVGGCVCVCVITFINVNVNNSLAISI